MIWHVLPINDLKPHEEKSTCACQPKVSNLEHGDMLVVHNAYDRREIMEQLLAAHKTSTAKN